MLKELLLKKKSSILANWVQSIYQTYPTETSKFLMLQKDRFSNPVGYVISESAEKIFDEFVKDNNIEKIKVLLDDFIKIRAVQDFLPSQAAGFIFPLKKAIFDELEMEIKNEKIYDEFVLIEAGIDKIALAAFDMYMEAREKVFRIRVNEIKSKSLQL